ncbi:MAG: diguanylate cyclase [Clostridia bacterium]|nr:diguanylate cyclase [Clostridia bacterium]
MKRSKKTGLSVVQNLVITIFIILFFLGVVVAYYSVLDSETRDNITKNGELNAVSTAYRIDKYLSLGVNALKLTSYTLDSMIHDNCSQEEILNYLVAQSFATESTVTGQINGVYGVIRDEYLDGSGWEPDEDFVPTERPWFIEAKARSGKVAIVGPYIDAMTGNVTITLSRRLGDTKSVVAIDIEMDQLQQTVEDVASAGASDAEIILNSNYQVIAHSDRDEIGNDYFKNDNSFGNSIVNMLRKQTKKESYFSLEYNSNEYIVYAITIENDWVCLSVINATTVFSKLRVPLILTIIAAMSIIIILSLLMANSNKKDAFAQKMEEIANQQTEYAYRDQMTGLKNRRAYTEELERLSGELPEDLFVIILDVNGLKKINDNFGHEAGDELIIAAATCIRNAFTDTDDVYRIGGDEFCVITSGTEEDIDGSLNLLDQSTKHWKGVRINSFSVSYGVETTKGHSDMESVAMEADHKMYDRKNSYYKSIEKDRQ